MDRYIVDYINALSIVVLAQAIQIKDQQRLLDRNADALIKCSETIEKLMEVMFRNSIREATEVDYAEYHSKAIGQTSRT